MGTANLASQTACIMNLIKKQGCSSPSTNKKRHQWIVGTMRKRLLLPVLLAAYAQTATGLDFEFTFVDNPAGDFAARGWLNENSLFQRNVRAAAESWGRHIDSNVTLRVRVDGESFVVRAGGSSSNGRSLGTDGAGNTILEPGPLSLILTGNNPGFPASGFDVVIGLDPVFVENNYWFDPQPEKRLHAVPFNRGDFISVIMHEFGHSFGVLGFRSFSMGQNYGNFVQGFATLYDSMTLFLGNGNTVDDNGDPNPLRFNGMTASDVFGDLVPISNVPSTAFLATQNFYHLGTCGDPAILTGALMNGCSIPNGARLPLSELDLALYDDLGYPIQPVTAKDILVLPDLNNSGVPEVAALRTTATSTIETRIGDSSTASNLGIFSFLGPAFESQQLLAFAGATGQPDNVLALRANRRSDDLPIFQLRDADNGTLVRNLFPWSSAWEVRQSRVIDGPPVLATLAVRKSDGLQGIELRNTDTGARQGIVYPLGFGWTPHDFVMVDVNGSDAVAVLNTRDSDGLTIVQVRSTVGGALVRNLFHLGLGWSPAEVKRLPDLNGNGVDEVAVRMTRDLDRLEIIQIRDSMTGDLLSNVYPIGAGAGGWRTERFEVMNSGGTVYLGVLSTRLSDGQVLLQLKNALTAQILRNTFFIAAPWRFQEGFRVIPDFNGNGSDEAAVLMRNNDTGGRLVQVRDSGTSAVIRNLNQPN